MELLEDSGGGKKPLTDWHGVMSDLFGVGQYFSFFVLSFLLNFIRCFRLNIDLVSVVESMHCADMSALIVLV